MSVFYIFITSIILFTVMYVFISSSDNTLLENTKFITSTEGRVLKNVIRGEIENLETILESTDQSINAAKELDSTYKQKVTNLRSRLNTISGKLRSNHSAKINPLNQDTNAKQNNAYLLSTNKILTRFIKTVEELEFYKNENYKDKCYYYNTKVWKGKPCANIGTVHDGSCGCSFEGGCQECE